MYYKGGISDIVAKPSPFTFSLYRYWFTGTRSVGKALDLLGVPHSKVGDPLLTIDNGVLVVDALAEEKLLLEGTVYRYRRFEGLHEGRPKPSISYSNIFNPILLYGTAKLTLAHSKIVSDAKKMTKMANGFKDDIPEFDSEKGLRNSLYVMENEVWPNVLAIGYLCDFWSEYLEKLFKESYVNLLGQINPYLLKEDWVYKSVEALNDLDNGKISLDELLLNYGNRAEDDYEITSMRWKEISPDDWFKQSHSGMAFEIDDELPDLQNINTKLLILKDLLVIRSETRKEALEHISGLRSILYKRFGQDDMKNLRLSTVYSNSNMAEYNYHEDDFKIIESKKKTHEKKQIDSGKGVGVSPGVKVGKVRFIKDLNDNPNEGEICIFPDAGAYYSRLYAKCSGIIFLNGGMMSHGSIVARELKISAIIDPDCKNLHNGEKIEIDGEFGVWKKV